MALRSHSHIGGATGPTKSGVGRQSASISSTLRRSWRRFVGFFELGDGELGIGGDDIPGLRAAIARLLVGDRFQKLHEQFRLVHPGVHVERL